MRIQSLSRFRLRKKSHHVDETIRNLVSYSYDHVEAFRAALDSAGIDPTGIMSRNDLSLLPIMLREDFVWHQQPQYTRQGVDLSSCYTSQTSGTSGMALTIYMSQAEALYRKLLLLRAMLHHVRLVLPFEIVEIGTGEAGLVARRRMRALDPIRVIRIPRSLPAGEQLDRLMRTRPHVITGHPSCIQVVAEIVSQRPTGFAPHVVVCRGEILHKRTRALLQEAFGCRVVNYYSCDEIGNIAWECPVQQDKLHLNTDGCVLEVVDETGQLLQDDCEGLVLVTNLFNRTMPFIRYQLGDRAAFLPTESRCACGYSGQSLALIAGREEDYFWLPDGSKISPQVISTAVGAAIKGDETGVFFIGAYQAVQESPEMVSVKAVPLEGAPADIGTRIARAIECLGEGITCRVELVKTVPMEPTGKHRKIVSNVKR